MVNAAPVPSTRATLVRSAQYPATTIPAASAKLAISCTARKLCREYPSLPENDKANVVDR